MALMDDEHQPAKKAPKKPATSRKRGTAKVGAINAGKRKAAPVSVPVIARGSDVARSQRTLVLPLSVLATILTLATGTVAWFSDTPLPSGAEPTQAQAVSLAAFYQADPLTAHLDVPPEGAMETGLQEVKTSLVAEPVLLGNPALR